MRSMIFPSLIVLGFNLLVWPVMGAKWIHTSVIEVDTGCCTPYYTHIKAGYWQNGACSFKVETQLIEPGQCFGKTVNLTDVQLMALVGKSWTCGETYVYSKEPPKNAYEDYQLILGKQGQYQASLPPVNKVVLHNCT